MTTLDWSWRGLGDEGVEIALQQLGGNVQCVRLELGYNNLSDAPPLTHYSQFNGLKVLNLRNNSIHTLTVGNIPPTTEILVLYNN